MSLFLHRIQTERTTLTRGLFGSLLWRPCARKLHAGINSHNPGSSAAVNLTMPSASSSRMKDLGACGPWARLAELTHCGEPWSRQCTQNKEMTPPTKLRLPRRSRRRLRALSQFLRLVDRHE